MTKPAVPHTPPHPAGYPAPDGTYVVLDTALQVAMALEPGQREVTVWLDDGHQVSVDRSTGAVTRVPYPQTPQTRPERVSEASEQAEDPHWSPVEDFKAPEDPLVLDPAVRLAQIRAERVSRTAETTYTFKGEHGREAFVPLRVEDLPRTSRLGLKGLTSAEHDAMEQSVTLWNTLVSIVEVGAARENDLAELCAHIHAIQHAILAQAAGRAHPGLYRLLGGDPL